MQVALLAFLGIALVLVMGFLAYHLWLICQGMTTYETFKWNLVHERLAAVHVAEQEVASGKEAGVRKISLSWAFSYLCGGQKHDRHTVTIPCNMYNQGLRANLKDAFLPPFRVIGGACHVKDM